MSGCFSVFSFLPARNLCCQLQIQSLTLKAFSPCNINQQAILTPSKQTRTTLHPPGRDYHNTNAGNTTTGHIHVLRHKLSPKCIQSQIYPLIFLNKIPRKWDGIFNLFVKWLVRKWLHPMITALYDTRCFLPLHSSLSNNHTCHLSKMYTKKEWEIVSLLSWMQSSLSTEVTENSLYPVLVPTAKDLEKQKKDLMLYQISKSKLMQHIIKGNTDATANTGTTAYFLSGK